MERERYSLSEGANFGVSLALYRGGQSGMPLAGGIRRAFLLHARKFSLPAGRTYAGLFRHAASIHEGRAPRDRSSAAWRVGWGTGGGHGAGGQRGGSEDRQEHGVQNWGLVNLAAAGTMALLLGENGKTARCSAHQLRRGFNDSNTVEKVRTSHTPPAYLTRVNPRCGMDGKDSEKQIER